MNCKPGDLAVVIDAAIELDLSGKIVRCISLDSDQCFPMWICDGEERVFDDELLRPIRDPGEDARDETLSWLPVPVREIA